MSDQETEVDTSDDLRASLESAFDEPADSGSEDRSRDEQGRFAKSDAQAEAPKLSEPEVKGDGPAPDGTRSPPASWSKDWHAHWGKLAPDLQDIILKREQEVSKGFEEKAAKLKPWERVEQLIQPVAAKYRMQGITEDMLVERLLTAHNMLENPGTRDQAWQFLLQQYGAPQFLAQQTAANQFQPQYQPNPYDQRLGAIEQMLRTQQESALVSHVETFAQQHPHFEKAAESIEKLLRAGKASDLNEAYEMAIWTNADIRKEVLADQAKEQVAKAQADTGKAKKAASSMTGAPTGQATSSTKASLRDELEAAYERF